MAIDPDTIKLRLKKTLIENARRAGSIHAQFLDNRQRGLEQMGALAEMQFSGFPAEEPLPQAKAVLFDTPKLVEFATGSMAKCFGPEFLVFEGRRHPRIPNGDLLLMHRILEITGERHHFEREARITSEYDVPQEAWFFRDSGPCGLPYSVWMEIALQPCGFLTAYLGTNLICPEVDYYFRNLDGRGHLLADMDMRGKTITVKARLVSTVNSGDTIIQKFAFECFCRETLVFEGESIFGFFPPETMATQAGLDAGKKSLPQAVSNPQSVSEGTWIDLSGPQGAQFFTAPTGKPNYHLADGQLNYLDRVYIAEQAGSAQQGYICGLRNNNPQAWFYRCHFYQDPVMPGSLGVEAILEAMQVFALQKNLGKAFRSPQFGLVPDRNMIWKYRGQILQSHPQMKLEVNINRILETPEQVTIEGDASLWADTMRIYEVKNAAICIKESIRG
jgi:3-hydroxymyristoyl/3-hydroxydecanoyl-(acyl carrier protein) dehydratase